jgi:hypothetical protein
MHTQRIQPASPVALHAAVAVSPAVGRRASASPPSKNAKNDTPKRLRPCATAITTGYASAATDDAVQANIVRVYRSASLKNDDH